MLKHRRIVLSSCAAALSLMGFSQIANSQITVAGTIFAGRLHNQMQFIIHNTSVLDMFDCSLTGRMQDGPMIGLEDTTDIGTILAHSGIVIGYKSSLFVPFGSLTHNNPSSNPNYDFDFELQFVGDYKDSVFLSHFSPNINITGIYIDFEGIQNHKNFKPIKVAEILNPVTPESGSLITMFALFTASTSLLIRRRH